MKTIQCNIFLLPLYILSASILTNQVTTANTMSKLIEGTLHQRYIPNLTHPFLGRINYPNYKPLHKNEAYFRQTKSIKPAHMLSIDLSGQHQQSANIPIRSPHPPVKLLGIDISVLSRHPEPNMPIAQGLSTGEKLILGSDFDPRYDRLPVIETQRIYTHSDYPKIKVKGLVYPFHHLPLNVMTNVSILKNKKQGRNSRDQANSLNDSEVEYTTNFILRLLYLISLSHQRDLGH